MRVLLPNRLRQLIQVIAIFGVSFCLPARAQDQEGWQIDSLRANPSVSKPDAQQIYDLMLKMLDRWNAHDIEGYFGSLLEFTGAVGCGRF
jgi:hypothetical protein